jgi:hypothetical protein
MSTESYEYGDEEINAMEKRVKDCNIGIIDNLKNLLRLSQGKDIPIKVTFSDEAMKKIDELVYRYKEKCYCGDANSIIWGDNSAYIEQDSHTKKKR